MRATRLALVLALVALGCAGPFHGKVWAKANKRYAALGEFERAEAACIPLVPSDFIRCMGEKGWILVAAR